MNKQENIFDIILKYPIVFIVGILFIIIIVIFLVLKGKIVKIWGLEIKDEETKKEIPNKNVNNGINNEKNQLHFTIEYTLYQPN